MPLKEYMYGENRYRILVSMDPSRAERLASLAQGDVDRRWRLYKQMEGGDSDSSRSVAPRSDQVS
jgi:pyruvate/2-oxoacid:ferredoxin oxidoreductase beta subunit